MNVFQLIGRLFKSNQPEKEWPDSIRGGVLAGRANDLHASGYSGIDLPQYSYRRISGVALFVLCELHLPNCLTQWTTAHVNRTIVCKYAKLSSSPPIIFNYFGEVQDGVQRLYAASERGDNTIMAYVPENWLHFRRDWVDEFVRKKT